MFVYVCGYITPKPTALIFIFSPIIFRDSGVKAIENLMMKKGKFDYILLETTGLADPGE